jgi:hypothetical protein
MDHSGKVGLSKTFFCVVAFVVVCSVLLVWPQKPAVDLSKDHGIHFSGLVENMETVSSPRSKVLFAISPDKGILTLFQTNEDGINSLKAALKPRADARPTSSTPSHILDAYQNEVWPRPQGTFIPGNFITKGLQQRWSQLCVPVEMLSCDSPIGGDWLHVEIWRSSANYVVVLYTDWN